MAKKSSTAQSSGLEEQKKTALDLWKNHIQFRSFTQEVSDYAIFIVDTKGTVINWNVGAERIKGYRADEIIGRNMECFYTHEDQESGVPLQLLQKAAAEGRVENEAWRVRKDGSRFWADVFITAVHDEDGNLVGFTKITRDMTERKKMEQELLSSKEELEAANAKLTAYFKNLEAANKELEEFAFIASHDLQEPIRKILTFSKLVISEHAPGLDEAGIVYLERVQGAAARMQELLEALLRYSRLTSKAEPFSECKLSDAANEVVSDLTMLINRTGGKVELSELPVIQGDPPQIRQLFQNLIANALKFHKDDVPPVVKVYSKPIENVFCQISVEDNGIGFDPEYAEKIFFPFQRLHGRSSKYEGTGMGLAICRKVVERHGGSITAKSELGKGSIFIVSLPCKQSA